MRRQLIGFCPIEKVEELGYAQHAKAAFETIKRETVRKKLNRWWMENG
jgi:hypothetical protein